MNIKNINVGLGETKLSKLKNEQLIATGLGSCIGLTMYDYVKNIAGMVHIVLPDSEIAGKESNLPGKYANTAIPDLLEKMINMGATKDKIIVTMAGGAQMFSIEKGSNVLNIGMRNIIATKIALGRENLNVQAQNTGGNLGRTMRIEVTTGIVYVKSIGNPEIVLAQANCSG